MNRPQAEHIARILCAYRPEWPPAAVASELTQAQGEDLDILTAAFLTARNPEHRTAKRIHHVLADLTNPYADPITRPTTTAGIPDQGPCPAHHWQPLTNCAACWSEIKTGQRGRDDYAKPIPWTPTG